MAARSTKSASRQSGMVRKSSAALCVVLAFAAGLLFGSLAANINTVRPAPAASQNTQAAAGTTQDHISTIEAMTRSQPGNAAAWIHLGDAYYDANQPERAIEAYERGLAINPDNPNAQTDLGTAYRMAGKYEQAIAHYNEALTRNPRHHNARLNKGIVQYFDLGRKNEGLETWKTLVSLSPDAKAPDGTLLKDFIAKLQAE